MSFSSVRNLGWFGLQSFIGEELIGLHRQLQRRSLTALKNAAISPSLTFRHRKPPVFHEQKLPAKMQSFNVIESSSKLLLGDLQVLNISVEEGTVTVSTYVPYYCYNMSWIGLDYWLYQVNLTGTPFTFSATENRFITIGCDIAGYIGDSDGTRFGSGCISFCYHPVNLTHEGACSGIGCCQTQIPNGVKTLDMSMDSVNNYKYTRYFSPCNYIFLARKDWFDFSSIDLTNLTNVDRKPPTVLDWAVGEETCESMDLSSSSSSSIYPCGPNTNCVNSNNDPGYRCVLNNCEVSDKRESEQIEAVAELAVRCLNRSGIERPTMKEVAEQLLGHMRLQETFQAQEQPEETESLLGHMTNINQ
ncbi:Wall-associated receptor kinase 2 [Camellia lanceoleosa]|nr:Wall-associated receptor kinase 2 [Camellia lanceoleosa]